MWRNSNSTNGKEIHSYVITIGTYLYSVPGITCPVESTEYTPWQNVSISESQWEIHSWGCRKHRETIDMILTARKLQRNAKKNVDLCRTFGNLTKAFNIYSHDGKSCNVWLFTKVHSIGTTTPWFHAVKGPRWCSFLWTVSCEERRMKVVCWLQPCSAWCFLSCLHILFRIVIMVFQSNATLIASWLT